MTVRKSLFVGAELIASNRSCTLVNFMVGARSIDPAEDRSWVDGGSKDVKWDAWGLREGLDTDIRTFGVMDNYSSLSSCYFGFQPSLSLLILPVLYLPCPGLLPYFFHFDLRHF